MRQLWAWLAGIAAVFMGSNGLLLSSGAAQRQPLTAGPVLTLPALAAQLANPLQCRAAGDCDIVVVHNQLERRVLISEITCSGVEYILRAASPPQDLLSGYHIVLIIDAGQIPDAALQVISERFDVRPGDARLTGCSEHEGEARGYARYISPAWEGVRTVEFSITRTGTVRIESEPMIPQVP